ncbi:unnamed protein product, partial [Heligmosomoides polygyrus]|uniref:Cyclin N-terminal domain-containing protein n=1 Tax=Heligmosomoides polygyrus TaxID=6339 RepID=A0A183G504_HELPZ
FEYSNSNENHSNTYSNGSFEHKYSLRDLHTYNSSDGSSEVESPPSDIPTSSSSLFNHPKVYCDFVKAIEEHAITERPDLETQLKIMQWLVGSSVSAAKMLTIACITNHKFSTNFLPACYQHLIYPRHDFLRFLVLFCEALRSSYTHLSCTRCCIINSFFDPLCVQCKSISAREQFY